MSMLQGYFLVVLIVNFLDILSSIYFAIYYGVVVLEISIICSCQFELPIIIILQIYHFINYLNILKLLFLKKINKKNRVLASKSWANGYFIFKIFFNTISVHLVWTLIVKFFLKKIFRALASTMSRH
jgi:hypothetical protein